jgi:hypothetical protein
MAAVLLLYLLQYPHPHLDIVLGKVRVPAQVSNHWLGVWHWYCGPALHLSP